MPPNHVLVPCPTCGASPLTLRDQLLVCTAEGCTDPMSAQRILATGTPYHIVSVTQLPDAWEWSIQHPLRERTPTGLIECGLDETLLGRAMDNDLPYTGTWRMNDDGDVIL